MSKVIRIGDVAFDARQYAINGTGILGIKKSGKSWLAKGIAEQMLIMGIPIIVFDAIGVWRHLKRAAGPGGRGFPIVVAGGKDPLRDAIADTVKKLLDQKYPVVLREVAEMGHQYIDGGAGVPVMDELVRWIDSLDRL